MYGHSQSRGRGRSSGSGWQRRLSQVLSYLLACLIGVIGVSIALIGVDASGPIGAPEDVWVGLIIGAVFVITAVIWLMLLVASYSWRS